ncbi:MAG: hypothetical protein IJD22_07560 [Clostridia bacterium]|nr:hypothetical protein [Clostridia bacterium]
MKIDKKTVDMLSSLPDESLWKMICAIGSSSGIDLSSFDPSSADLARLRVAMSSLTDKDISRALDILGSLNKGGPTTDHNS